MDTDWLISEYIRQGKEKYERGKFSLHTLDDYGQRINIITAHQYNNRIAEKRQNRHGDADVGLDGVSERRDKIGNGIWR